MTKKKGAAGSPAPSATPAPATHAASAPAPPTAAANCDPPYYFDANGNRIYKRECL